MLMASKNGIANGIHREYVGGSNQSKVDRYNWTIKDEPGHFQMIDKNKLNVEPSYQRPDQVDKIRIIARSWSWQSCGTISVSNRDGYLNVTDGKQRTLAARNRADITMLPCFVFDTESEKEEAQAFIQINTLRKPVNHVDKFKALIIAEDSTAIAINNLILDSGWRISSSPKKGQSVVSCVRQLMDLYRGPNKEAFLTVWPLILEVSVGNPIYERVVASLTYIESKIRPDQSLAKGDLRRRVTKYTADDFMTAANKAAAFFTDGGAKVWAAGALDLINRGCRNRISLENPGGRS
jgi:hypothetical protein